MLIKSINKKYKVFIIVVVIIIGFLTLSYALLRADSPKIFWFRKEIYSTFVKLTCVGKNKQFMRFGLLSNPVCVKTYDDKGKPCSSSSECLSGLCVITSNTKTPYCRGVSRDFPLCFSGEATVEYPGVFLNCD